MEVHSFENRIRLGNAVFSGFYLMFLSTGIASWLICAYEQSVGDYQSAVTPAFYGVIAILLFSVLHWVKKTLGITLFKIESVYQRKFFMRRRG